MTKLKDIIKQFAGVADKAPERPFYNVWSDLSEDGLSDFDKFVETELIPNGMRTLRDTAKLSSDQGSIRYMIARPINS